MISPAEAFNLLDDILFNWIVVQVNFGHGLVVFQSIFDFFSWFPFDKVVSQVQSLDCRELTLDHVDKFLSNVLTFNLAFWQI
jgi:hypothetical protein